MSGITDEVRDRIRKVKALVLDVDGVLTDGRLVYLPDGQLMPDRKSTRLNSSHVS